MTNLKEEVDSVIDWTKKYFSNFEIQKAIVGISGGIDSAVTAAICTKALGQQNVIGVLLPCDSAFTDTEDAITLSNSLNISSYMMSLESMYRKWWNEFRASIAIPGFKDGQLLDINKLIPANAKARLRMLTLYAVAGQANGLVAGTTNKTEALLGYATKYGDGGVDIEPIMDFYKTEIFEMAKILNIPCDIIDKPPSAGLWLGQTDEGELGMTYKEIDEYLIAEEKNFAQVIDPKKLNKIEKLINLNKHKDLGLPHYKRTK